MFLGSAAGIGDGNPATAARAARVGPERRVLGLSVAAAGDVNGDGYADVIVGAPYYYDAGRDRRGRAFVFLGAPPASRTATPRPPRAARVRPGRARSWAAASRRPAT